MNRVLVVDRINQSFAICETPQREMLQIPLEALPPNTQEGDCVWETPQGYHPAPEETEKRRKYNLSLQRKLFGKQG